MKILYAILDLIANDIGPIITLKHDAAAVRTFTDLLKTENTTPNKHPADFNLIRLGHINDDHQLVPDFQTVMTGEQWLATQQQENLSLVKEA